MISLMRLQVDKPLKIGINDKSESITNGISN